MNILLSMLLVAGLIGPGWGWARGANWPAAGLAAGFISALAILGGVVGFSLIGVPLTLGTMAAWLGIVALGGGWFYQRRAGGAAESGNWSQWRLALPVLPLIAVAAWRAMAQPLPGADVDFRWNYLAELLVQTGRLDYYPPIAALDFTHYFWVDGITPLVSSLYAWTYLVAGSVDRHWTAFPVLLQVAGLLVLLHALGGLWGGARAGWLACALGGATFLLQFAFNLGQETGLTALGAGGMVYFLLQWQRESRASLLVPAAAGAALAACAREYGIVFALVGTLWVLGAGGGRRSLGFALLAMLLPAIWHGRNWVLTGNPFYSLDIAGLFPVNPIFAAWMSGYADTYSVPLRTAAGWAEIARLLGISAVPALFGLIAGGWLFRGRPGWLGMLMVAGATLVCWVASVPFTAGGLFYSMRVLSPLLVLGCAWGGAVLAQKVPEGSFPKLLLVGLALYGLDASLRAWTVPANPYRLSLRDWPVAGYSLQRDFEDKNLPFLLAAAGRVQGKVLSESAGAQRIFRAAGRDLVPLWSPEVEFLFGPTGANDAVARLQALGYSHVLLTRVQSSVDFLTRQNAIERLNDHLQAVMANETFVLFALVPEPPRPPKERQ